MNKDIVTVLAHLDIKRTFEVDDRNIFAAEIEKLKHYFGFHGIIHALFGLYLKNRY